jgi:predicted O-methyltransferase YrrM
VKFEAVRDAVAGIPIMSEAQGRVIYDHVLEHSVKDILELGTAWGVSAAYMAAALDERGEGKVTTLDKRQFVKDPGPELRTFSKLPELRKYVEFIRTDDKSYVWWLARKVEASSDAQGNVSAQYDFCYLDGAHDFTIDGLSVYLVEKLLRPGSWLTLDDLNWSFAINTDGFDASDMSKDELRTPHMRMVFDLCVKQHPNFTNFKTQDGSWGWAKKDPGAPRRYSVEVTQPPSALIVDGLKRMSLSARSWIKTR